MFKTFKKGGIHPAENKITVGKGIVDLPLSEVVTIPVTQHIGARSKIVVEQGEQLRVGQVLAEGEGFVSSNIHSSVSGKVSKIDKFTDASGYKRMAIQIEVEGDEWIESIDRSETLKTECNLEQQDIIKKVHESGIVGMGGATFPTHVKLTLPRGERAEHLIVNGVECEPYLTSDHALMLEKGAEIFIGIRIMMKALDVKKAIVGIEENKSDAIDHFISLANHHDGISVQGLRVKYPQGSEKQLLQAVLRREVPSGGLPIDVGAVVFNVGTIFAVYEAIQKNKPLFERITTVTGHSLSNPANYKVRIGTHISDVIAAAGGLPENTGKIIAGGPMMGKALNMLDIPVTKGTSGILLLEEEKSVRKPVSNCIRCSKCIDVCPMGLEPYLLMALAENDKFIHVEENRVNDCMECGSCSYICPANRPLLDYIRLGKTKVRELDLIKKK